MKNVLIVSVLLLGLLGAFPTASSGGQSTLVNVGGFQKSPNGGEASTYSNLGKFFGKFHSGGGASAISTPFKFVDKSLMGSGGSTVPVVIGIFEALPRGTHPKVGGGSTTPYTNHMNGTFQTDPNLGGQPGYPTLLQ